jgi:capsular polysaccharide export protein
MPTFSKHIADVPRAIFQPPPFPGAVAVDLVRPSPGQEHEACATLVLAAMRKRRVGGQFWLPSEPVAERGAIDPWTARTDEPVHSANDPAALLDAIIGRPVQIEGDGIFAPLSGLVPGEQYTDSVICTLISRHLLSGIGYLSPFTGKPVDPLQLVDILGDWRDSIDMNRPIAAAFGFAPWKRETVSPLLWSGRPVPFLPPRENLLTTLPARALVAVWKARVPADFLAVLEAGPWHIVEIEDGFIRSAGLGADCVPPLSIVMDDLGVHYDPTRANHLENLLSAGSFTSEELERGARLRRWLVEEGVSKYRVGAGAALPRPGGDRRHILVVGQVEDDRSILMGGGAVRSNLELLRRVRILAPDAFIVYRPHPDVEAGHRRGAVATEIVRQFADRIDARSPISALIAMVDEVHVITSLAGFEALLHGKTVTTHGTPFFAGWGLTRDLSPTPARRGKALTLDQLTTAVLLVYPRYLDPITNLPCPPEILILRLLAGVRRRNRALVRARRLFGWVKRAMKQILGMR